ncbi:PTS fructose transporter subunit EIIBC [Ignatzschineria ureiclastica]|uniref:protein-N(pi)-phosphohistidine--D-fructose phosphotransferase n=1 Tax=Ignatzschineria ureiclastica TaxID=472582 RepID=A0A2U2AH66_9GAMM|nr:fructose-specific PTS transporter subunit EIIC [Ignatzschineria ureiclastica]PWD81998.1 PTS fructose transporter subunit EIIBC [Ignatzschineria ureiclastica]GGZ91931.1 PTS system fructose-specific EIIB'BC component [Ignatzschineria ureiclastica]
MNRKLWVVVGPQTSDVRRIVVLEALKASAEKEGITLDLNSLTEIGRLPQFSQNPTAQDAVLLVDLSADQVSGLKGQFQSVTADAVLDNTTEVLQKAVAGQASGSTSLAKSDAKASSGDNGEEASHSGPIKIVGITSCPTGIAHTFMAAEGLINSAKAMGIEMRVETQGSVGAQDTLTAKEIREADIVMIAADREVDRSRFNGKRVFSSGTKKAISDGQGLIEQALKEAKMQKGASSDADDVEEDTGEKAKSAGVYKHLMNGVSFMLPFVVAGGLLMAIAFAVGGINVGKEEGTLGYYLFTIGSSYGLGLMVPVLAGYIAFSIADRPGLAPGMIGGMLATATGSGFLGGIIAGFVAGYFVRFLVKYLKLPRNLEGLKPILILPLLGTLFVGLIMVYIVGEPVAYILHALENWLKGMQGAGGFLVGALIGGMMAVDMGGPVNKAAYATSAALIGSGVYEPMAAVMAAGMVPPLAAALATRLYRSKFTKDEYESGAATGVLGLSFISEGAIPFAARDPLRVIPAFVVGAAVAGGISMMLGCELRAPHGGIFVLFIPGAISHLLGYVIAIVAGTVVSALLLGVLKKRVEVVAPAK